MTPQSCADSGAWLTTRGLNADNTSVQRYGMTKAEIISCAHTAALRGYGTIVLQSGENYGMLGSWLADIVQCIRRETPLAVTLSVGERDLSELRLWREAGANRYLLRFETSDQRLFRKIHPPRKADDPGRFAILSQLRALGYEVGSGIMIGLPGQTISSLADDLEWFRRLDLDMIGVGPYLPHPHTMLAQEPKTAMPVQGQALNNETMTRKVIALTRLLCPLTNIPSTTALATLNPNNGLEAGLTRGANVVMPNITPRQYRAAYEIYPDKICVTEDAETSRLPIEKRIALLGRHVGEGRGDSPNWTARQTEADCIMVGAFAKESEM